MQVDDAGTSSSLEFLKLVVTLNPVRTAQYWMDMPTSVHGLPVIFWS